MAIAVMSFLFGPSGMLVDSQIRVPPSLSSGSNFSIEGWLSATTVSKLERIGEEITDRVSDDIVALIQVEPTRRVDLAARNEKVGEEGTAQEVHHSLFRSFTISIRESWHDHERPEC